jgi:hypothetical protein
MELIAMIEPLEGQVEMHLAPNFEYVFHNGSFLKPLRQLSSLEALE